MKSNLIVEENEKMSRNVSESVVNRGNNRRNGALRPVDGRSERARILLGVIVDVGDEKDGVYDERPHKT